MDDKNVRTVFAKNLNYYLNLHEKKQSDVADQLEISRSTFSSWCTGEKIPRMDKVQALADYFRIQKSDLIDDKPQNERMTFKKQQLLNDIRGLDEDKVEWLLEAIRLFRNEQTQKQ